MDRDVDLRPSNPPTLSKVTFISTPSGSASAVAACVRMAQYHTNHSFSHESNSGVHDFGLIRPKFWTSVVAALPAPPAGIADWPELPFIAGIKSSYTVSQAFRSHNKNTAPPELGLEFGHTESLVSGSPMACAKSLPLADQGRPLPPAVAPPNLTPPARPTPALPFGLEAVAIASCKISALRSAGGRA